MKGFRVLLLVFGFCLLSGAGFAADLKVGGFGQWWYYYTDAGAHGESKFIMQRMRFKVSSQLTDKAGFFTQFDFKASPADIHLLDAWLDVKLAPWLTVRAGQFAIPFGFETPISPWALDVMSYSYVVGAGEPTGVGFFPGIRDIGLQFRGKREPIDYAVAVINGKGLTGGEDNKFKDVAGRLGFSKKGIGVGGSGYYGFVNATGLDSLNNVITYPDSEWAKTRFGADLEVDIAHFLLKTEVIMGSQGVGDTTTLKQMGYYATLGYTFVLCQTTASEPGYRAFQPVVRYDAWDPNSDVDDNGMSRISAGANFWFDKDAKVSAFYEIRSEQGDTDIKDNRLRLQLGLAW
jgi:hypothetical protein